MNLSSFFQIGPISADVMTGSYNLYLVALSYAMACLASYIALDITERIRSDSGSKMGWLVSGALAMGCGIWTMHFIGMLALIMPMAMGYNTWITFLSLVIAVVASGFALFLIKDENIKKFSLVMGGILLGLGICSMHYTGMAAMQDVQIRYDPFLFALSVAIAIAASETALYLMIIGTVKTLRFRQQLKAASALIMGLAICGMHYTGMAAAVFIRKPPLEQDEAGLFDTLTPDLLSFSIAMITVIIMAIALGVSKYWVQTLKIKNKELMEAKLILNRLVEEATAREKRISDILFAAVDGIVVTDDHGSIEMCNRAAVLLFGAPDGDFIGKQITNIVGQRNPENGQFEKMTFPALVKKSGSVFDLVAWHSGELRPVELTLSPSLSHDKTAYVLVFRDIEERKKSEEKLAHLNQQLVASARLAGMAEVATSVLHNVGNILNSVNVTVQLLIERNTEPQLLGLERAVGLLEEHRNSLDAFVKEHPVGTKLLEYLRHLAEFLSNDSKTVAQELNGLNERVHLIKNIVVLQQSLSNPQILMENVKVDKLVDDALAINSDLVQRWGVVIKKEYDTTPLIETDRVKVVQILVNLIKNAIEAMVNCNKQEKIVTIKIQSSSDYVQIEVIDNGEGIKDITKVFAYGFTTKQTGHGFGLHSSARIAQDMGGSLRAYSQGQGHGSTFSLILPIHAKTAHEQPTEMSHGGT
jgi:PAS domain S-box-containing protein